MIYIRKRYISNMLNVTVIKNQFILRLVNLKRGEVKLNNLKQSVSYLVKFHF